MQSEFKLIENLKKLIGRKLQGPLGIGDDAAILPEIAKGRQWILSTDVLVEEVDFRLGKLPPEMAGRKALAINLSDIAAMGGIPSAFVVSLGIPPSFRENWIRRFYRGMMRLARQSKTACIGGDISRAREFFASIAILGHVKKNQGVTRRGAKRGDLIFVTGKLGGSILGRHYQFTPRLSEAGFLCDFFRPTAMMDISDGFIQDLGHILKDSGIGARLDLARIPVSKDARRLARRNSQKALRHALTDGEDFELLFTLPRRLGFWLEKKWKKRFPRVALSRIGEIISQKEKLIYEYDGKKIKPPRFLKKGFSHF